MADSTARPGPPPEQLLQRFEIQDVLGAGATAVVYKALDRSAGRFVALKILKAEYNDTALRARFEREARISTGLSHPNLVTVLDSGEADGRLWIAMELVEGRSLAQIIRTDPRDLRRFVAILARASDAIGVIHARGVVHRDLKPANILVTSDDQPKVGDFGLARIDESDSNLTQTGVALGTPLYMSPEQIRNAKRITPAADVHALGAVLYEITTTRPPFIGLSVADIYARILHSEPPRPGATGVEVHPDLEAVILRALEKEPSHRYRDAAEFAADLRRWLEGQPVIARQPAVRLARVIWRRRALIVAGITLAIAAAAAFPAVEWTRRRSAELESARVREESARVIEECRTMLDQAASALHNPQADYDAFALKAAELRAPVELALARSSGIAAGHTMLGRLAEIAGDPAHAEACLRKAIALDPDAVAPRVALGRLLMEKSYLAGLATRLPLESGGHYGADVVAHLEAAIDSMSRTRGANAVQIAVARAMLAEAQQDRATALKLADEAIVAHGGAPGIEELHWLRGTLIQGPGALESLTRAIELRPKSAIFLFSRGTALDSLGRLDEAIADYTAALRIRPRFFEAHFNRGAALASAGRIAEALHDLTEAATLRPDHAGAMCNLAAARLAAEDPKGALEAIDTAIGIEPDAAYFHLQRARIHRALGDANRAIDSCDEAIRLDPRLADSWHFRAMTLAELNRNAEAVESCTKGLEADRNQVAFFRMRARCLWLHALENEREREPLLRQAVEDYRTYLSKKPDDHDTRIDYASLAAHCGMNREAARELRHVIAKAPADSPVAREATRLLESLRSK